LHFRFVVFKAVTAPQQFEVPNAIQRVFVERCGVCLQAGIDGFESENTRERRVASQDFSIRCRDAETRNAAFEEFAVGIRREVWKLHWCVSYSSVSRFNLASLTQTSMRVEEATDLVKK